MGWGCLIPLPRVRNWVGISVSGARDGVTRDASPTPSMATVELSSSPLPAPHEEWGRYRPNHLSAYTTVLNAERYAGERVQVDSSSRDAKNDLIFARIAGYLLIELYNRRKILSDMPCAALIKQILSPSQDGGTVHDTVLQVGKWHFDYLIRTCTFGLS